jgi:tight adherence protein C
MFEQFLFVCILCYFLAVFSGILLINLWVERCNKAAALSQPLGRDHRRKISNEDSLIKKFPRLFIALEYSSRNRWPEIQKKLRKYLIMSGQEYILPCEYMAMTQLRSIALCLLIGSFLHFTGMFSLPVLAIVLLVICSLIVFTDISSLRSKAIDRTERIAFRLPYAVDQIALILSAGGHFQESLSLVLKEMENHPLAEELTLVHRGVKLGMHRHEMLKEMASRLNMPMVNELVTTIIQGENSGTPLSEIFQTQAEQMRLKRTQFIEQFAAKIGVKMSFPGMLCMISCLVIIVSIFGIYMKVHLGSDDSFLNM